MALASARRLAAAGAVTAFIVGGVTMVAGVGTAMASDCKLLVLVCDEPAQGGDPGDPWKPDVKLPDVPIPHDTWSNAPAPDETWSNAPAPHDTWSSGPAQPPQPEAPWKPVDEGRHRMPDGPPQTGAGGLAGGDPMWPFAAGGAALLTGAGLAGFALRRGRPAPAE
ncbi:hypothetical protein GCM10010404_10800 [Nonomuraea africana]|uniref:LPXTG cell wall anchor domain-containing protein n=1 Tax=Nonomuraea africana TaxID=46171 RepID=A0ABR9K8M7_9ACTN|nr:hypothetical protein [Nonomuraea africana]MBE1558366.1 hypothetical protein [Nonomuraea africana]